jgi:hypothetical protein
MSEDARTAAPDDRGVDALIDAATNDAGTTRRVRRRGPRGDTWWRRNRVALPAAVVLLAGCVAALGVEAWTGYYIGRPMLPATATPDRTVEYAGVGWRIADVDRVSGADEAEVRTGTPRADVDVVFVTIVQTVPELGFEGCLLQLREKRDDGSTRTWDAAGSGLRAEFDPDSRSCRPESTGRSSFEAAFVIPARARGEFEVLVVAAEGLPGFARLELP